MKPNSAISGAGAYVSIPKDLAKIKNKFLLNMTRRQIVCFGSAAAVGFPTYLGLRGIVGGDVAIIVMIALMLPLFFMGVYERDGQPAEKIALQILRWKLRPAVRTYKSANFYEIVKEGNRIASNQKAKRRT